MKINELSVPRPTRNITRRGAPSPHFAIALLVAASACSFTDRQIMSLLVGPIQRDLGLSDTDVSLLLGLAFVLSYAFAGPPIGLLVDRTRRWTIVSAGIAFWSVMTGSCAFAGSYAQLFFCRMGVGIGEATLNPASYSLIPDLVRRERLGLAVSTFGLGVYLGAGIALLIGGQIIGLLTAQQTISLPIFGTVRSWQAVFFIVAVLGLPLAFLARLMPEPERLSGADTSALTASEVLAFGHSHLAVFAGVTLCWAGVLMAGYGLGAWFPTFMIRSFGWTPARAGLWFGLLIVSFGATGAIVGGLLTDRAAKRSGSGRIRTIIWLALSAIPCAALLPLAHDVAVVLALTAVFAFLQAAAASAAPAVLQDILPSRMRGLGSALAQAVTVLFGLGLGPTIVALITDHIFADKAMLRYALALAIPSMLLGAALAGLIALPRYSRLRKDVQER